MQILEKRAREERRVQKKAKAGNDEAILRQPAEYQKIELDAVASSLLEAGLYDDKPLIFFGKDTYTKQIISNPSEVHKIIKSFQNYRDIIEGMENEGHEHIEADLASFG